MHIERVEAFGFGPFAEKVLDLPVGMTLVFGPNEAGKSSWHAALYAGMCGIRRGRGRPTASDQEFESRYRPWEGGPWQVRAVVALADGRRVELTQDLAARSGTAHDLVTGRDITNEILNEQVPDASRWLGLDRDAFRAAACVPQTALLQILEQPQQLADHLQRAAATAGTDATAAEAIRRISEFLADYVGTERAWTKPLAKAKTSLADAQQVLNLAKQTHAKTARLREDLHDASLADDAARHRLRLATAADARQRANDVLEVWKRAADLSARYPEPPPQLTVDDALAQQARVAVKDYRNQPDALVLEGLSATELETQLASLPPAPAGDTVPAPEAVTAYEQVRQAHAMLQSVIGLKPPVTAVPERTLADVSELRRLADALAEPLPQTSPGHNERPDPVHAPAQPAHGRALRGAAVAVTVVLTVGGVAVATAARQPIGWAAVAAGVIIGAVLIINVLREHVRQIAALTNLQAGDQTQAMRLAAEQRLTGVRNRIAALGLPADPEALRKLADADDHARTAAEQWVGWQQRHEEAETDLHRALSHLSRELGARGATISQDPEADFRLYSEACAERGRQAAQAGRRRDLESRLQDRQRAEDQATNDLQWRGLLTW